jgi:hypothetical protein
MKKAKGKSWGVNLNQRTGDAFGGPGLAVGGDFNGSINGTGHDFYGGNATSGSIGPVTVGK